MLARRSMNQDDARRQVLKETSTHNLLFRAIRSTSTAEYQDDARMTTFTQEDRQDDVSIQMSREVWAG